MKRVVTGHDANKKSVFVEVEEPEHTVRLPGIVWHEVWATHPKTTVPLEPEFKTRMRERWKSVFPAAGETRVRIVEFDPEQMEDISSPEMQQRMAAELPGLGEHMEPDAPGMHTTDSVDYGILLKGKITLELDDGKTVDLEPGDVVVQNGTRHAWRYTEKCTIAWILIGVARDG